MEEEEQNVEKHFIGLDLSTQQIKAVVIDENLQVVAESAVHFDSMLPEYRTHGGVNISGISGAGQQHGSVYWRIGAQKILEELQPERFLHDQLASAFSLLDSPIWMDSSTTDQCAQLEEFLGGPETLTALTGSRAYERFTVNQIKKIRNMNSIFAGKIVDIDWSDGSGMNLLNLTNKSWVPQILNFVGDDLEAKLGQVTRTDSIVGTISTYMQERYGFPEDCLIGAFTGDNPSSMAGLGIRKGDLGYSLGTSDTVFACVDQPNPQLTGHIFTNPIHTSAYMAMLCYKNGSLTRERVRGNFGNIGVYYDLPEIVPAGVQGDFRFNKSEIKYCTNKRALVEGQILAKRFHAERMGFRLGENGRVLVTGGASANKAILQVIADVFNSNVYSLPAVNSAALGGAYRALHLFKGGTEKISYDEVVSKLEAEITLAAEPNKDAATIYNKELLSRFANLEQKVVKSMT